MNKLAIVAALAAPSYRNSVHGSHLHFGGSGLPEVNVDRITASPFVCFAGDDDGGGAGAGGAGEGGAGGAGKGGEKTFTQAELNAHMARERKATEERVAKAHAEASAKLEAELADLRTKFEDAGKSAAEREKAAAEREKATMAAKLAEREKALTDQGAANARLAQELRDTRLDHELTALLGARKVLPQALRAAMLVFRADAKFEYDADGRLTGIDIGDQRFGKLSEAVDDWMKSNGSIYVEASGGGAGTRPSTGGSSTPHLKKTNEQLIAEADALRGARR